ncbi:MAG: hypothetical protein IPK53_17520 [bacterium]|nr:hypothetical protein [bacterium]
MDSTAGVNGQDVDVKLASEVASALVVATSSVDSIATAENELNGLLGSATGLDSLQVEATLRFTSFL